MEYLLFALVIGVLPAWIAHQKGRSFPLWWAYGTLLLVIALPHSLLAKPNHEEMERQRLDEGMKKCPKCAELIRHEAVVCRYCRTDFSIASPPAKESAEIVEALTSLGCQVEWLSNAAWAILMPDGGYKLFAYSTEDLERIRTRIQTSTAQ